MGKKNRRVQRELYPMPDINNVLKRPIPSVFGIVSDTHIGSLLEDLDGLESFYDDIEARGIKQVYHAGDICVSGDSFIQTSVGLKKIRDVAIGDFVLTHKNRYRRVLKTFSRKAETMQLKLFGDAKPIRITSEHPVWAGTKWFRYYQVENTPNWVPAGTLTTNNFAIGLINSENRKTLPYSNQFLRIIGYFLGDGSVYDSKKRATLKFYFGTKKEITAKKDVMEYFRNEGLKVFEGFHSGCWHLTINNTGYARFFKQFYDEKREKNIPNEFLNCPLEQFLQIVHGLVITDGSIGRSHGRYERVRINNTSYELLRKVKLRLESDGEYSTMNVTRPARRSFVFSKMCDQKEYYELNFSCGSKVLSMFFENVTRTAPTRYKRVFDYTIKGIESISEGCEEDVFNLEVEEDDSYVAEGIILHNCDGEDVYHGHDRYVRDHGFEAQAMAVNKRYPKRDGVTTSFITGNHCASFLKKSGADIGLRIHSLRDDLDYLGQFYARIDDGLKIDILHPLSHGFYAKSYGIQKYLRSNEDVANWPDILIAGHTHQHNYFSDHGVDCINAGNFQKMNEYGIRQGYSPDMGGWIIELDRKGKKVEGLKLEWRGKT